MVDAFIHETAVVDEGVDIGAGTKIWHFSHVLKGSFVGQGCNIGQNVVVGPDGRGAWRYRVHLFFSCQTFGVLWGWGGYLH